MVSIIFQKKLLGIFHDVYDDGFYLILPSPDVGIFHDVYDYVRFYLLILPSPDCFPLLKLPPLETWEIWNQVKQQIFGTAQLKSFALRSTNSEHCTAQILSKMEGP